MAKVFEFPVADARAAEAVLTRARARARRAGVVLEGDGASGSFSGAADGTYAVHDHMLRVEVRSKPVLVPWSVVESALRSLFG